MSVTTCVECGAKVSTLATKCTKCGAPPPATPEPTVFVVPTAQTRIQVILLACAVALTLPVVVGRAMDYGRTIAAERASREQALAEERARDSLALQVRGRASADSARRSLPLSQLRRAKLADLRGAVSVVGAYRADSSAKWLAAARTELTRREKLENDRLRAEPDAQRAPVYSPSQSAGGYYTGPRGGCYTYSRSGRKRYVDRSRCN
jgi:hypothetical protein